MLKLVIISFMNALILIAGGFLFKEWVPMLYTVVYIYVTSVVVDMIINATIKANQNYY